MKPLAAVFGITTEGRTTVVREMLERHVSDRAAYWLALGLAACIATLGLVLDSPGVVIGAMLISPLMSPIVELGMGLAIGSPLLVVRAFTRSLVSVAFVAGVGALITLALPYHEITGEIAARTSPTVLDLCVAVCCAVAAVYATAQSSKAAGIASGTAIGIALVPPICTSGYGIGSGNTDAATGAMLLFVANVSAIVLVAVVSFLLLRFDKVDVHSLEEARIETSERTSRSGRWLHGVLGTRYGRVLRVLMPAVVAVAVYVPLRRAMREVSWEIRVRTAVAALLRKSPEMRNAIRSSLKVDHHTVSIEVAIVGSAAEGARLEGLLEERVAAIAGFTPKVAVLAVAGAANIQRLERSFAHAAPMAPQRRPGIADIRGSLDSALKELWPDDAFGPLLDWQLQVTAQGTPTVDVFHHGEPLGEQGAKLLAAALTAKLDAPMGVRDVAYSSRPRTAEPAALGSWIPLLRGALDASRDHGLFACVALPSSFDADAGVIDRESGEIQTLLADARSDRLVVRRGGEEWSVVLSQAGCADVADSGAETGAPSLAMPPAGGASAARVFHDGGAGPDAH